MEKILLDREEELNILRKAINSGDKVLIIGLRGYGKSTLVKEFHRRVVNRGKTSIFVDCLRVHSPEDLESIMEATTGKSIDTTNAKRALESFFNVGEKNGVSVFILDEFTTLFRRFGMLRPYRGVGGPIAVAEHFKSILENTAVSVIVVDTSFKDVNEYVKKYSAPLFREFTVELKIGPLPVESAIEYVVAKSREWGIELSFDDAKEIAELFGCVPFYLIVATRGLRKGISPRQLFMEEVLHGALNEYFTLLMEKFSFTEQQVLYVLSRCKGRFFEVDKAVDGAAQALDSLLSKGIISKIEKSRKEVYYRISDRVFNAWLAMNEHPRLKSISFERIKVSSLSFESLIRESLFRLREEIVINDLTGKPVIIGPYKSVERILLPARNIEIDALAEKATGACEVYEIYFGEKMRMKKMHQLERAIIELSRMEYHVEKGFLVSYFGFSGELIERCKNSENIFLLGKKQIKTIVKKAGLYI